MLQFDEYRVKLNNLKPDLDELGKALDLESAERELDELHAQSAADGFWDNVEKARKVQKRISNLEDKVNAQARRQGAWDDLMTLCEMGNEEEDESLIPEVESGFDALVKEMETARLSTLLSGEYDNSTAIVSLQAGAGGTEAQDWAQMLYRMYTRWAERHGFTYQIIDYLDGDEAGIKSATISDTELAAGSLHSISPNRPGASQVISTVVASCIIRPYSESAASKSVACGTPNAKTKSTLKSPCENSKSFSDNTVLYGVIYTFTKSPSNL